MKWLVERGADWRLTVQPYDGAGAMTCLHLAALSGCVSACAYLIDLGCDINSDAKELKCFCNRRMGLTPLYLAVTSGDPQTVSLLLQHGAEVDVTVYEEDGTWLCERGITPLHQAARLNHATICELLCDEGRGCQCALLHTK